MSSRRTQIVLLVVLIASTITLNFLWRHQPGKRVADHRPQSTTHPVESDRARALVVLRSWDSQRAAAYSSANAGALSRLYVPGSVAGANDVRMLRQYAKRGWRVTGMRIQILGIDLVDHSDNSLSLVVTERLAQATARATRSQVIRGDLARKSVVLPRAQTTVHRVELRRSAGSWLVNEVSTLGAQGKFSS